MKTEIRPLYADCQCDECYNAADGFITVGDRVPMCGRCATRMGFYLSDDYRTPSKIATREAKDRISKAWA